MSQKLLDLKKLALEKMNEALQQIHQLQVELLDIVGLNKQLSELSENEISSILYKMDDELRELRNSFIAFTKNYQQHNDQELIQIHQGIKKSLKIQTDKILSFCESDSKIEAGSILESTEAFKRSSKTIASVESLLIQRKATNYTPTIYSTAQQLFNRKLDELEHKENSLNLTIKTIESISQENQDDKDIQNLLNYIRQGGNLYKIEEHFDCEKIELLSSQEQPIKSEEKTQVSESIIDIADIKEVKTTASRNLSQTNHLQLFIVTLKEWLNTPSSVDWQQCKALAEKRILNKQ